MTEHLEDEETDVSQADQPESDLPHSVVNRPGEFPATPAGLLRPETVSDYSKFSTIMTLVLFGGILFAVLVAATLYIYLIHITPPSHRLALSDGSVEASPPPPKVKPRPTPVLGRTATGELIPVTADDLHVTSIALGDMHLGIVNGKRLAEGDWLEMKTPLGVTYVRLTSLEDGVAHFDYGGQPIDAKLQLTIAPKKPPGPEPIAQTH